MITRKHCLSIILTIALMLLVSASAWAETIRLKNGRIFDGEFIEEIDDEFKILMNSGIMTFSRDEIESIGDRKITQKEIKEAVNSLSAPPAAKKPVVKKKVKPAAVTTKTAPKKKQNKIVKVKKIVPQVKAKETSTFTQFTASTDTVTPVSSAPVSAPVTLPAKPNKGLSLNAKSVIAIIGIVIIAGLVFIIKRLKKQPKDKNINKDINNDASHE